MTRLWLLLVAVLIGLPVVSAHAEAATYPPGPHVVLGVLSERSVADGKTVVISGNGFVPSTPLVLAVDGRQRTTLRADATGAFSVEVRMTGVREHLLAVTGTEPGGRVRVVSDPVTVTAASTRPVNSTPFQLGGLGSVLALLGGLLTVVLVAGGRLLLRARRLRPPAAR